MDPGIIGLVIVISLIVGTLLGVLIGRHIKIATASRGVLYVKLDAPEGQGLFLEQLVPTSVIASNKAVLFDVVVINPHSQK